MNSITYTHKFLLSTNLLHNFILNKLLNLKNYS
jgi:hypothetical protein